MPLDNLVWVHPKPRAELGNGAEERAALSAAGGPHPEITDARDPNVSLGPRSGMMAKFIQGQALPDPPVEFFGATISTDDDGVWVLVANSSGSLHPLRDLALERAAQSERIVPDDARGAGHQVHAHPMHHEATEVLDPALQIGSIKGLGDDVFNAHRFTWEEGWADLPWLA